MNRLTKLNNKFLYEVDLYDMSKAVNKLGKLEDLEQEVGCPLEVALDILLTLKSQMKVDFEDLYIVFNGESLRFKDRETEKKIIEWLKGGKRR